MAYKNNDKGEHAFKKIDKDIKKGELNNLLLFYGREEYLIQWAVSEIIGKYINPATKALDFTVLEGTTATYTDIRNSCETMPMMSEKRVVLLSDFKLMEGLNLKNFNESSENYLRGYFEEIPDSCILMITNPKADKRKKIFKSIEKFGTSYDFCELDEKQLLSFINKRLKKGGKSATTAVLHQLIDSAGYFTKESDYTLYNLENDIKKVIAYSEETEITTGDVAKVVAGNIDTNVFAMIDAISRNRKDEAFSLLANQLLFGENVFKLLGLICSQFETILAVKELKSNGNTLIQIKQRMGIHEFRIKRAVIFAERYTVVSLKDILKKVYAVDKNIKTGLLEPSLALEMLIAEI